MEPENTFEPMPETEAAERKNFFSRLGGVYVSPKNAFQEIGGSPNVLMPIIALIVVGLLLGIYISRTLDMQSLMPPPGSGGMPNGQMGPPGFDMMKFMSVFMVVISAIQFVLSALIIAGLAKLFSVFLTIENRFKPIFSVTLYAVLAIAIVQTVVTVLILSIRGVEDITMANLNTAIMSNLGAVLSGILDKDALPRFVILFASAIDIFAIWKIALLALGYSAVSRKLKTAVAATWLVAVYLIVALISAALSALFGPQPGPS